MKNIIVSLLLSFQFFTSIPIRKHFTMNQKTVTGMFICLPIISLFMGMSNGVLFFLNNEYFQFSPLLLAIILVIAGIVMSGGLHLDGWIDMCDAYFSYQDQKKRLEILSDPRVGAFGAIGLVVLLLLKIGFYYEVLTSDVNHTLFLVLIPFISRIAMLLYFLTMQTAKTEGLATYFKTNVIHKHIFISIVIYIIFIFGVAIYINSFVILLLIVLVFLYYFFYRKWTKKNFGGMTGDLLGAIYESSETLLWGALIIFI
ncbi:adenosylcobinamide-GDP ribazoletransferase [Lysinibacillus sp. PLM2]|nr:adenosylcobinamide-GDP ribazoletransferase [Lysinibacillus sp. PLM2]